jgi:hypothetical protein
LRPGAHSHPGQVPCEPCLDEFHTSKETDKKITAQINEALVNTFVTQLEREDFEVLSAALYRIPKTCEKLRRAFHHLRGPGQRTWTSPKHITLLDQATQRSWPWSRCSATSARATSTGEGDEPRLQQIEGDADAYALELLGELYSGRHEPIKVLALRDLLRPAREDHRPLPRRGKRSHEHRPLKPRRRMISFQRLLGREDEFFGLLEASAAECVPSIAALRAISPSRGKSRCWMLSPRAAQGQGTHAKARGDADPRVRHADRARGHRGAWPRSSTRFPRLVEKFAERYALVFERVADVRFDGQAAALNARSIAATMVVALRDADINKIKSKQSELRGLARGAELALAECLGISTRRGTTR